MLDRMFFWVIALFREIIPTNILTNHHGGYGQFCETYGRNTEQLTTCMLLGEYLTNRPLWSLAFYHFMPIFVLIYLVAVFTSLHVRTPVWVMISWWTAVCRILDEVRLYRQFVWPWTVFTRLGNPDPCGLRDISYIQTEIKLSIFWALLTTTMHT